MLFRTRDRKTLGVEQTLDQLERLDVFRFVVSMTRAGVPRANKAELRFPKAQNVGLDAHDLRRLTNLKRGNRLRHRHWTRARLARVPA